MNVNTLYTEVLHMSSKMSVAPKSPKLLPVGEDLRPQAVRKASRSDVPLPIPLRGGVPAAAGGVVVRSTVPYATSSFTTSSAASAIFFTSPGPGSPGGV